MLAMGNRSRFDVFLLLSALSVFAFAQQPATGAGQNMPQPAGAHQAQATELPPEVSPNYTLGPTDHILIRAPGADEINERPFRINAEGYSHSTRSSILPFSIEDWV